MCTVSMVIDGWSKTVPPPQHFTNTFQYTRDEAAHREIEKLRRDLEALKELIRAAKRFDEVTEQPDCEDPEKVALLRRMAELLGVDLEDILE